MLEIIYMWNQLIFKLSIWVWGQSSSIFKWTGARKWDAHFTNTTLLSEMFKDVSRHALALEPVCFTFYQGLRGFQITCFSSVWTREETFYSPQRVEQILLNLCHLWPRRVCHPEEAQIHHADTCGEDICHCPPLKAAVRTHWGAWHGGSSTPLAIYLLNK